jgi:hypothetical protein
LCLGCGWKKEQNILYFTKKREGETEIYRVIENVQLENEQMIPAIRSMSLSLIVIEIH